ncbi:uncharacterized protein LOC124154552 [Ischnura elegans]|uniref:uncharacterized protein LOC124154552 n=1 Tax=Ischnura elegans TaxID=197161 RepID=UPI001ED8ACB2|nr:uncharacterized protein LOC124154552 [Ischnura elegans]
MSGIQNNERKKKKVKKMKIRIWNEMDMDSAVEAVANDNVPFREAAKQFDIPETTLRRRYQNKYLLPVPPVQPGGFGRFKVTFSAQQGEELKALLIQMDKLSQGLTWYDCRRIIYEYADRDGIPHQFSRTKQMASSKWTRTFMQQNAFRLGRRRLYRPWEAVGCFFEVLGEIRMERSLKPGRIYHVMEMSFSVAASEHVADGQCAIATTLSCGCATGHLIPPFMIFPLNCVTSDMIAGAPPGTTAVADASGSLNLTTFVFFLAQVIEFAKPTKDDPIVLLIGKRSLVSSYWAAKYARDNNITLMAFPKCAPCKMKPLSLTFLGVLREYFRQALDSFHLTRDQSLVKEKDLATLFGYAFTCAARCNCITPAFETSGIDPFNPDVASHPGYFSY